MGYEISQIIFAYIEICLVYLHLVKQSIIYLNLSIMIYQINIALNGKHFFATAEHSITEKTHYKETLKVLQEKFTKNEGYSISATIYPQIGFGIDINDDIDKTITEIYERISK